MSRVRSVNGWALYDWGNSAFATTVMAGFFPVFFKQYWSLGTDSAVSTLRLGVANSAASLVLAVLAPIVGAWSDRAASKKRALAGLVAFGAIATGSLALLGEGMWAAAIALYIAAIVGFNGSITFYESLLPSVAPTEQEAHRVSALGYSLGYLGGGLLFAFNVFLYKKPELFGLADAREAVKWSFVSVAVWWIVFTVPLMAWVKEPPPAKAAASASSIGQVLGTVAHVRRYRNLFLFLAAYWLYMDGVGSVVKMSVDYGLSIGLGAADLITALLLVQFVGFPSTIVFGRFASKFSPKHAVIAGLAAYFVVVLGSAFMTKPSHYYAMAVVIGLVQGGVQSVSRSIFSGLVPPDRAGEFFGFFNVVGRFASVLGPILVGLVGLVSSSPRVGILSLAVLIGVGMLILTRVDLAAGRAEARRQSFGEP